MSAIPPNLVGPILQSPAAQQQAARVLEKERAQQSDAAAKTGRLTDRAAESIGESDNDARVDADAEGAGSQGRFSDDKLQDDESEAGADQPSTATDSLAAPQPDQPPHLDLQA